VVGLEGNSDGVMAVSERGACTYRAGGVMIMRQNRVFATPSTPHPGQPKPNPAHLDQYGGCCKRFWGQVGEV